MSKRLVLIRQEQKIISFYLEEEKAMAIACVPEESLVGRIYLGRVKSVVKNLQSAFIEMESGKLCYLPFEKNAVPYLRNRTFDGRILEGDEILVQVTKDRTGSKEPVATTNLTFTGRFVVVTFSKKGIGYSNKLTKTEIAELKSFCNPYFDSQLGYVIRTNAALALMDHPKSLADELKQQTVKCQELLVKAKTRTLFSLLYQPLPSYLTQVQDMGASDILRITTDDIFIYEQILQMQKEDALGILGAAELSFYADTTYPLTKLLRLEKQLEDALAKRVWLKSGGYLIIEPTEALTIIDVNSGKFAKKKSQEEAYFLINQEAAFEIVRQLKVRNLSGIILIDFINMKSKSDQDALLTLMRKECAKDKVTTTVVDITALGLMELTRKRIYPSLKEQLTGSKV